jgi:AcrR family transcriptional regulator
MARDEPGQRPAAASSLSKQRVVTEAIKLADRDGVDGLSMRRLAGELGAGAMSLYHYVANKEELLDAMVDVVFDEIALPAADGDWKAAMRATAVSSREVLGRHPWAISLMESRTNPGPANLRHREAFTACLRTAGFSVAMATHANWLLNSYVYGFVLQETNLPFRSADELAGMIEGTYLPQLPSDRYPYLNESAATLAAAGYDPADEFTFGLDFILDGFERLQAQA